MPIWRKDKSFSSITITTAMKRPNEGSVVNALWQKRHWTWTRLNTFNQPALDFSVYSPSWGGKHKVQSDSHTLLDVVTSWRYHSQLKLVNKAELCLKTHWLAISSCTDVSSFFCQIGNGTNGVKTYSRCVISLCSTDGVVFTRVSHLKTRLGIFRFFYPLFPPSLLFLVVF